MAGEPRRDGDTSDEAVATARQLVAIGRIDAVLLFLVVAVMALKPTASDVAVLAELAAVLVVGSVMAIASARSAATRAASA